jgi:hypothetical protein
MFWEGRLEGPYTAAANALNSVVAASRKAEIAVQRALEGLPESAAPIRRELEAAQLMLQRLEDGVLPAASVLAIAAYCGEDRTGVIIEGSRRLRVVRPSDDRRA